ncbi:MAG: RnfABCDGE type electron transport complex subunit G [Candidatus Omnitrophica bacterium]|nr:RnfABCDGE type electron transport complex subunit G [Candidatus Omnitrophota bacterium]
MNNIFRFAIILLLVNLVAASILAGVYGITKPKIEAQKILAQKEALREVMPESIGDRLEPIKEDGQIKYWQVFKGSSSRPAAYIFVAKKYGYSSIIETMVGMKKDGTITGIRILSQNETPGLGAKMIEIVSNRTIVNAIKNIFFKDKSPEEKALPYFTEQFKGLDVKKIEISDGGIQAITGATISSKAVVDSIKAHGLEILNAK